MNVLKYLPEGWDVRAIAALQRRVTAGIANAIQLRAEKIVDNNRTIENLGVRNEELLNEIAALYGEDNNE